jgi:hypothetical protein
VLGRHFSPRPNTVGLAQRPNQRCARALGVVTARWPRAWRRGFTGGLGVARPVWTPRGSDGGCVGQGGVMGFSPETASGSGVAKTARRGGEGPVAGEGIDECHTLVLL